MFRNRWGYFSETWCEDTFVWAILSVKLGVRILLFGQYAQSFFDFHDLTYFVAYSQPS
jgi:hypothetical protein